MIAWKRLLRTSSSERFVGTRDGKEVVVIDLHHLERTVLCLAVADSHRPLHGVGGSKRRARHAERRQHARAHEIGERRLRRLLQRETREGEARVRVGGQF